MDSSVTYTKRYSVRSFNGMFQLQKMMDGNRGDGTEFLLQNRLDLGLIKRDEDGYKDNQHSLGLLQRLN